MTSNDKRLSSPPFLNEKQEKSRSTSSNLVSYTCKHCEQPITSGHAYELGDDSRWHIDCFQCDKCNKKLSNESDFLVLSTGALVCYDCSDRCTICKSKIDELAIILSNSDEAYCRNCFKCSRCDDKISNLRYAKTKKGLYCINCHEKLIEKRKQYKLKQQQMKRPSNSRHSSTSGKSSIHESDDGSEFDFSRVSSYEEARDISNKAKHKVKQLPSVPLSELRKRRDVSNNENWNTPNHGSERSRIASPDSDYFRYKQPPEYHDKPKFSSSESLINLSAHTTAESSPVVLQQGQFATKVGEKPTRETYMKENYSSNNDNAIRDSNSGNYGLRSAPLIDMSSSANTNSDHEDDESTWKLGEVNSEKTNSNIKQNVPPRSQPLYHARTLSQQKNEVENMTLSNDPMLTSPTVLGNKNVKKTPTITQTNNFNNINTSATEPSKGKTHSRQTSIDDVLASTISHNQNSIDSDLLLNKTPLKNITAEIVEEEDHGYQQIDTSMFHNGDDTAYFMDNKDFLADENVQMALKMTSAFSPHKEETVDSSQDEYVTAFNSSNDLNKTYNATGKGTPSKFGRSLSFKSPKKFFQNLTKSPKAVDTHKRNISIDSKISDKSAPHEFGLPPLPKELLTEQQQQKMGTQKGNTKQMRDSNSNQMYSSNPTMPLSEQTLMDGQQAKMKLNIMLKNAAKESSRHPIPGSSHQRSISASSALQRSIHSRQASLDYMKTPNTIQKRDVSRSESIDFEKKSDNFQFGTLNNSVDAAQTLNSQPSNNNDINDALLQMRKLNLDVYNLENTKRILVNEVESLTNQKNKLLLEVNELNINIKTAEETLKNIHKDSGNSTALAPNHARNLSVASSSFSNTSDKTNNMSVTTATTTNSNSNNNGGNGRFWKNIFQKVEKTTTKAIDKNSIRMSTSVSQPMLNNIVIPSGNSYSSINSAGNGISSISSESMNELIRIEKDYNMVEGDDFDSYTKLTSISNQNDQVRDLSVIGYCKVEGHEGIPYVIRFFVDFLQNNENMMRQEGIYRKAASKIMIERFEKMMYEKHGNFVGDYTKKKQPLNYGDFYRSMSDMINSGADNSFMDVHLIASCFKRFLKRLLIPVIPYTNYFDVIHDITAKVNLPKEHEQTLKLIASHMIEVSKLEFENKMTKYNLAMVFAPSLVRDLNNEREMMDFKERVKYIEYLISS